ncbi:MAG: YebC/PmpR family DNA-binding transcriptional regulator [Bdellovibrio sp.]
MKTANAQKKGAQFTKFAREIQTAAKLGGGDPQFNSRLRMAIDAAKKASCPNDTIDRAIKKGTGHLEGGQIDELVYEGYGPHSVGVIVECLTDNKHRTAPEIRLIFKNHEGSLGETGSVAWMFKKVSEIQGSKEGSFDLEEEAIEAGADDVFQVGDITFFLGAPEQLDSIRTQLQNRGWKLTGAKLGYTANNDTELSETQRKEVIEFLQSLEEHDDVQRVFSTLGA